MNKTPIKNIHIAWAFRNGLKPGETCDEDGFAPMEFSFTDGRRITVEVKDQSPADNGSCPDKKTIIYTQIWVTRDGETAYITTRV